MFSDVFDALCSAFRAYSCPVPLYLGKQYLDQHTAPSRIVFWQDADTFGPQKSSIPVDTRGYNAQSFNPRPLATRTCGVVANIWARVPELSDAAMQYRADLALLEATVNMLLAALNQIASGITVSSGGVMAEQNGSADRAGLVYELRFTVDVPIVDPGAWRPIIDACTKTWREMAATSDVTIAGRVDTSTNPPSYQDAFTFPVPTPEE